MEQSGQRTAVITGATSTRGIGRATADVLAAQGWSIGVLDLDQAACDELARELTVRHGVAAFGAAADVSDEQQARSAIDAMEAALPPILGLLNSAGVSSPIGYFDVDADEWHRVIGINLTGAHYVTRRVAETMVRNRRGGRIISLASVSAQRGGGTFSKTPYSVAKAGLIGLTRSLARELGPYDITVNAIAPGPIDTDIMGGPLTPERKRELADDLVVNRIGQTRDVAAAVAYLISDDAGYVSGQTLNVDGGLYMH